MTGPVTLPSVLAALDARRAEPPRVSTSAAAASQPAATGAATPFAAFVSDEPATSRPTSAPAPEQPADGTNPLAGAGKALRDFEAFVLQSFIQEMLPDGADSVVGKGIAGEVWKSMLAENVAKEIAKSGDIGIASRIAGASGQERTAAALALPGVPMAQEFKE